MRYWRKPWRNQQTLVLSNQEHSRRVRGALIEKLCHVDRSSDPVIQCVGEAERVMIELARAVVEACRGSAHGSRSARSVPRADRSRRTGRASQPAS
jgi:hypothetical protein